MGHQAEEPRAPGWRGARQILVRLVDRLIPPSRLEGSSDELRRLRLIVGLTFLSLVITPIPAIQHALDGLWTEAVVVSVTWVVMAILMVGLRAGMRSVIAGHGMSAALMATAMVNGAQLGGVHSPPAIVLMMIPVISTVVVRGNSNWLWCALALGMIAVLDSVTPGWAMAAHEKAVALGVVMVAMTGLLTLYESSRLETIEKLEEARVRAEVAAEAKSRFLANMSHEIRTPLNGVLGMLGILQETPLTKDQHDFARTAHSSGVMLLDLINDILDFSKIEAGQMLLEATPFDLQGLAEDVLDQVAVLADGKGIELVARYVPLTPTHVIGDPGRIRQILLNLVNNAVKFTEDGHVLLTVEEVERQGDRPVLRCSVEDTGIGIPEQDQPRVFEHFAQVDGSPSRQQGGTGLGLAIVRELTALMEGRVGLSSTPGKGSTFWVELPLTVSKIPTESRPEALVGRKLLVVDDNRVNRWVLREQLARWKFRLEEAASGPRALELMREAADRGDPFDIALLDYHMPRMDGLELTRTIKADDRLRGTRLVMLSSVTSRGDSQKLLEAGCAAYLIKPVHQSDLMNTLANVWDEEGPVAEPTPRTTPDSSVAVARGRRVLVVEDNAVNQKVATRMLMDLGAHVDVAGDGVEAVAQVEAFPYDLVFMDVQMPRMDGLDATREIRAREGSGGKRLTIVAMTAHALDEDRDRCLEAGMDGYVRKPISRRDLIRALRDHLGDEATGPQRVIGARGSKDKVTGPQRVVGARVPGAAVSAGAAEGASDEPCDLDWLRNNYDADDVVVRELLGLFMRRAADLIPQMASSQPGQPDFDQGAHALKGLCGTVRARPMYALLDGSGLEVAARMSAIERAYLELRKFLARTLDLSSPALETTRRGEAPSQAPSGGTQALPTSAPT